MFGQPTATEPQRRYARRQPENSALHAVVKEHLPAFRTAVTAAGHALPRFVVSELERYLACGLLEHGFVRVKCTGCRHEQLVAFSCKGRGFCPSCGARRMADTSAGLVDRVLPQVPVRQWVLSFPWPLRDADQPWLDLGDAAAIEALQAASIRYRVALGSSAGQQLATRIDPRLAQPRRHPKPLTADSAGWSLNAAVGCPAGRRDTLERLCRYVTRPAIAQERLRIAADGAVVLTLKRPFRYGTTHVRFSPLDFVGRLAALVPRPRDTWCGTTGCWLRTIRGAVASCRAAGAGAAPGRQEIQGRSGLSAAPIRRLR